MPEIWHAPNFLLVIFLGYLMTPEQAVPFGVALSLEENKISDTRKSQNHAVQKSSVESINQIESNVAQSASSDIASNKTETAKTFEAPYPFTADELWENILKVVDLPEGYATKEQVENIFGVTLKLNEEARSKPKCNNYGR